jgi:3-hydroxybutyryl-CoA dehydratase
MSPNDLRAAETGALIAEYHSGPITREMLRRYAEASGDLNPLHTDPAFARKAGFPDVIAHGMLGMALLGRLLTDRFEASRLRTLNARFTGIVHVNTSLHCVARLESCTDEVATLVLEALDAQGVCLIAGSAQIAL